MRRRLVEPAGSRRADLRRGLAAPTPTVAAALAGPRLTHNPSRSTVEPENGGYLGDIGLGMIRGWLASIVLAVLLAGCASSSQSVLYPNAHLNQVGKAQSEQDIAACQSLANS